MEQGRRTLPVLNQYQRGADARLACVPISIMALYHQYEGHQKRGQELDPQRWNIVLERGVGLWKLWRAKEPVRLPTVTDVLALPECAPFVQVFGREPREFAGLVRDAHGIDQPDGNLAAMLRETQRLCCDEARTVCCLLVLPNIICCSLLCLPPRTKGGACELRFFDSHDAHSRYCDYAVFSEHDALLRYILTKYPAREWCAPPVIDGVGDDTFLQPSVSIERVQAMYGYSAMLFIK